MAFTHQETAPGLDDLEDTGSGIALTIHRKGAEMVSLRRRGADGAWRRYLHLDGEVSPADASWPHHATVMGYYLHRLWRERSDYRGFVIHGGNHGFIRDFAFDAPRIDADAASATYTVPADRIPAEAYPLKVRLELTYRLRGGAVEVAFRFTNEEPELDAHVSFGLHPGFAVGSLETARVLLAAGTYVRHFAPGNFLNGETERIAFDGGPMPFAKAALPDSFLLGIEEAGDRIFRLEDPETGRAVAVEMPETPYLTLWSNLDPFICIEPCWGLPDSNPPKPFPEKTGIQVIPAGQTLERTFAIRPGFLE